VQPWQMRQSYSTYRSPYGPQYGSPSTIERLSDQGLLMVMAMIGTKSPRIFTASRFARLLSSKCPATNAKLSTLGGEGLLGIR
jgi:hypothetical protein